MISKFKGFHHTPIGSILYKIREKCSDLRHRIVRTLGLAFCVLCILFAKIMCLSVVLRDQNSVYDIRFWVIKDMVCHIALIKLNREIECILNLDLRWSPFFFQQTIYMQKNISKHAAAKWLRKRGFWLQQAPPPLSHNHSIIVLVLSLLSQTLFPLHDNNSSLKELIQQPVVKYLILSICKQKQPLSSTAAVCNCERPAAALSPRHFGI